MKFITQLLMALAVICLIFISLPVSAANKTIYIKPFGIESGLPENDPLGTRIQNYIAEDILDMGGYSLTSDDEVRQVLQQEELRMSLNSCSDDSCIKQLMESIRTDYIIYGTISFEDGKYHITAKMLDRSDGTIRLARVKTLILRDKNMIRMACTDLTKYLLQEKSIDMKRYDDSSYDLVKKTRMEVPTGLSASFLYFMPLKTPFKDYYDSLMGGELDYCHGLNNYIALTGGISYVLGNDKSGDVTVSLNSYSIGVRAGLPLGILYPYIGIAGKVTWYNERSSLNSVNFIGYGGDAAAGCAFILGSSYSIWADYTISILKLNDDAGSDISGTVIRAGFMYAF